MQGVLVGLQVVRQVDLLHEATGGAVMSHGDIFTSSNLTDFYFFTAIAFLIFLLGIAATFYQFCQSDLNLGRLGAVSGDRVWIGIILFVDVIV